MIEQKEIVSSLTPLNGIHFTIANLNEYAAKVATLGKSVERREEQTGKLISYVLYYDNGPDIFITMVWTHPEYQGKGYAKGLLTQLIYSTHKDIRLDVHKNNVAKHLYADLGFISTEQSDNLIKMSLQKRIAVMQPYIFPYIGYFHLIESSNLFVFYDDVNYILQGWINRNQILLDGKDFRFTVPILKASPNKLINETRVAIDDSWRRKFRRTLELAYRNAPYFSDFEPVITSVFSENDQNVADLAINSIASVYTYLGLPFNYTRSSVCSPETKGIDRADRLIEIARQKGFRRYVNSPGGKDLYAKEYFQERGIELSFIESDYIEYKQYSNDFVPWLSIIDILMFNDPKTVRSFLKRFRLT